jgi:hypothetical protein
MSNGGKNNQGNQAKQGGGKRKSGRRRRGQKKPVDLWRPVPQLEDPKPIVPATDPTILIRSLGDPPLHGQGQVAEHYMAAVIERAAGLATALAATANLLELPGEGPED